MSLFDRVMGLAEGSGGEQHQARRQKAHDREAVSHEGSARVAKTWQAAEPHAKAAHAHHQAGDAAFNRHAWGARTVGRPVKHPKIPLGFTGRAPKGGEHKAPWGQSEQTQAVVEGSGGIEHRRRQMAAAMKQKGGHLDMPSLDRVMHAQLRRTTAYKSPQKPDPLAAKTDKG